MHKLVILFLFIFFFTFHTQNKKHLSSQQIKSNARSHLLITKRNKGPQFLPRAEKKYTKNIYTVTNVLLIVVIVFMLVLLCHFCLVRSATG